MALAPARTPLRWIASRRARRRTVPPVFGRRCSLCFESQFCTGSYHRNNIGNTETWDEGVDNTHGRTQMMLRRGF